MRVAAALSTAHHSAATSDRESDIVELFERQAERTQEAGLLVRVNLGRQRKVQVWDAGFGSAMIRPVEAQPDFEEPVVRGREVEIESQGSSGRGRCGRR